jgi:predicted metal-binding membrane protein
MTTATFTETFLRRDRSVVLAGLGSIVLLSWVYLGYLAWDMATMMDMSDASMGWMAMPAIQPWGAVDYLLMFIMWSVMMFAMMTPSAAPMVLTYTKINRQRQAQLKPVPGTAIFYMGYLLVWTAFSAMATLAQGGLHAATLLSPMMETTSPVLGGIILIAAGVFQFTPLKYACLSHCRTPLGYFMTEWREGKLGALVMGVRHGAFCVGCCWLIMALLFVAGVMNLFWIAVIAAYVLAEKLLPGGHKVSWGIGALIIGWGVWMIMGVLL